LFPVCQSRQKQPFWTTSREKPRQKFLIPEFWATFAVNATFCPLLLVQFGANLSKLLPTCPQVLPTVYGHLPLMSIPIFSFFASRQCQRENYSQNVLILPKVVR